MRINIYQVDSDKDENRVRFCNYDYTQQHGGVLPQNYKCVFHGDVDGNLEDVFTLFNTHGHPGTFQGHSLSVSDVIEVVGRTRKTSHRAVISLTALVSKASISTHPAAPRWTESGC